MVATGVVASTYIRCELRDAVLLPLNHGRFVNHSWHTNLLVIALASSQKPRAVIWITSNALPSNTKAGHETGVCGSTVHFSDTIASRCLQAHMSSPLARVPRLWYRTVHPAGCVRKLNPRRLPPILAVETSEDIQTRIHSPWGSYITQTSRD